MGSQETSNIVSRDQIEFPQEDSISEEDAAAIRSLNLERVQFKDGSVCYFANTPDGRREVKITDIGLTPAVAYYTGIDESTGTTKINKFPIPGIDRAHITRSGFPNKDSYSFSDRPSKKD